MDINETQDGSKEYYIAYSPYYRLEGKLVIDGKDYKIAFLDIHTNGRYNQFDFTQGTSILIDLNQNGELEFRTESFKGSQIFPIGDEFYEIKDIAEDGSEITFAKSGLVQAKIGDEAPNFRITDINGKEFSLLEHRGKIVIIDFWASWCIPCIREFPKMKKIYEDYKDNLTIISISIDREDRVNNALETIKKYELLWIIAAEGKGEFFPAWQIYCGLNEVPSIPIYIVINQTGVVKYGGRDMKEVETILDELIKPDIND